MLEILAIDCQNDKFKATFTFSGSVKELKANQIHRHELYNKLQKEFMLLRKRKV